MDTRFKPDYSRRVVITGIGMVSPLGLDTPTTWDGLINGRNGIEMLTLFDASPLETRFGGECKGFDPANYINKKDIRRMDRFAQLAVAAARMAVEESKLDIADGKGDDIGVIVGSGIGGLTTLFDQARVCIEKGPSKVTPFLIPMMISDIAAAQIAIAMGLKGPNFCTTSACSSGSDAIGTAYEAIREGRADTMLAGGTESGMNVLAFAAFNALNALSTNNDDPHHASRPFDAGRSGFVMSEGACVVVLEELTAALKRGAHIYAEVLGYGNSCDAFHIVQPIETGEGAARAMKMAVKRAGIEPGEIDYINAHGTSTQLNDKMETSAIKQVLGDHAYKVPISSTKSMLGHLIGGAGAIECAICALVIKNGIIPPTINYTTPDSDCDLDYTPNTARIKKVATTLSNSFGFGGHNSVIILRQYE
ncbi:beta-ketoacyl-ACP synthase II [Dehalogenimonas alkenigignens]|nr:beta-ketoacyl-ACP synthase II [Dehalogenimonas alkenigignens]PVV85262.1 beta-ketoacyl-[acyl-carrier-protein] synthase II [Dehalogenimonas alkenigignens]